MAINDIKLMLGISQDDTGKDELINQLLENTKRAILLYINEQDFPPALEWIADEITVAKYNQLDALGIQTEKIDSVWYTYKSDIFQEYKQYMDMYMKNNETGKLPKLRLI